MFLFVWLFLAAPSLLHVICPSTRTPLMTHAADQQMSAPSDDRANSPMVTGEWDRSTTPTSVLSRLLPIVTVEPPFDGIPVSSTGDYNNKRLNRLPEGEENSHKQRENLGRFRRNLLNLNQPEHLVSQFGGNFGQSEDEHENQIDAAPKEVQNILRTNLIRLFNDNCGQSYWRSFYINRWMLICIIPE